VRGWRKVRRAFSEATRSLPIRRRPQHRLRRPTCFNQPSQEPQGGRGSRNSRALRLRRVASPLPDVTSTRCGHDAAALRVPDADAPARTSFWNWAAESDILRREGRRVKSVNGEVCLFLGRALETPEMGPEIKCGRDCGQRRGDHFRKGPFSFPQNHPLRAQPHPSFSFSSGDPFSVGATSLFHSDAPMRRCGPTPMPFRGHGGYISRNPDVNPSTSPRRAALTRRM
jgi:hypothetical protein